MEPSKDISEILTDLATFLKSRFLIHLVFITGSVLAGFFLSDRIEISELKPVVSSLQSISASVFTLAGIWIAYSYPQAITAYTSPSSVKLLPTDESNRIENLVLIVLTSAFVISTLLVINLLYLLIYKSVSNTDVLHVLKALGISSLFYLAFIQLRAIYIVMATNVSFVNELHIKKAEKKAREDM